MGWWLSHRTHCGSLFHCTCDRSIADCTPVACRTWRSELKRHRQVQRSTCGALGGKGAEWCGGAEAEGWRPWRVYLQGQRRGARPPLPFACAFTSGRGGPLLAASQPQRHSPVSHVPGVRLQDNVRLLNFTVLVTTASWLRVSRQPPWRTPATNCTSHGFTFTLSAELTLLGFQIVMPFYVEWVLFPAFSPYFYQQFYTSHFRYIVILLIFCLTQKVLMYVENSMYVKKSKALL